MGVMRKICLNFGAPKIILKVYQIRNRYKFEKNPQKSHKTFP
jgi:hypothetical protein